MRRILRMILSAFFMMLMAHAAIASYGARLCKQKGFKCYKVERTDSWSSLFPKKDERELVKFINRTNEFLSLGMVIAIPEEIDGKTIYDFSPFPSEDKQYQEKVIVIDHYNMAWAAYEESQLLRWGPISAGSPKCFENPGGCQTPGGQYQIIRKNGKDCASNSYPQLISGERGGAAMPYCMFFYKGYAIHGSYHLPGYHNSHGCVRLLVEDAKWLFYQFATLGTKVLVITL